MSTIATRRYRLACDLASQNQPLDKLTDLMPKIWRANAVRFELAFFFKTLDAAGLISDTSNLASLTLQMKTVGAENTAPTSDAAPLAAKTTTDFSDSSFAAWDADTDEQAAIEFTDVEMSLEAGEVWLVISIVTKAGKTFTALAGVIEIAEDGFAASQEAPVLTGTAYSKSESDARYAPIGSSAAGFKNGSQDLDISDELLIEVDFPEAFADAPSTVLPSIKAPSGGDAIGVDVIAQTADGFTARLRAPIYMAGYKLSWLAVA